MRRVKKARRQTVYRRIKQEARLSQRDRAMFRVSDYFAKLLKVIRNDTVEYGVCKSLLRCISASESNKFAQRHPVRCHRQFSSECHKARSSDRSCFFFTLPTCCTSLNVIISRLMHMQTTPRFTVTVSHLTLVVLYSRCPSALTRFRRG